MLAELREKVVLGHAGLLRNVANPVIAEHVLQLVRRDGLVRAVADPGPCDVAETGSLELGQ